MTPVEPWQEWEIMAAACDTNNPREALRSALSIAAWTRRPGAYLIDLLHPSDRRRRDRYERAHGRLAAVGKVLAQFRGRVA